MPDLHLLRQLVNALLDSLALLEKAVTAGKAEEAKKAKELFTNLQRRFSAELEK